MPKEYDCNTHSQCQLFTPTFAALYSMPPSYPALFSLTFQQKLIPLPSGSHLPLMTLHHSIIQTALLPHEKTGLAFLWDHKIPNGQAACNLWAISPPGSTFSAGHIFTNKAVSSFEPLLTNTPLGGLLMDDMGLGETIQDIELIGTTKEQLFTNFHCSTPTSLNYQLAIRNIQACSGWNAASENIPWSHLSLIIQGQHYKM
ncbi:hypothetical protein O181_045682 [Austropuccinia psidii MF-1]|uniref:SNF2 N-terminal domain-containing protein n=1 Tax=Austropuccinia psidii MF-1 TaxID=1389203 RepID=A0A9Q3DUC0_9BASI|nr:hypothetical protein [Austropuccinia psidii MF-1]